MQALDNITQRRSVRKFTDEKVKKEDLDVIMDACRYAPSWANYQVARYTVVQNSVLIEKLAEKGVKGFGYNSGTLKNAKNVLVLSFVEGKSGKLDAKLGVESENAHLWEIFDAGIACQTFCLAAHAQGVGTCIFGVIDNKAISEIVDLPADEKVAALIPFGYPAENPPVPTRLELSEICRLKA